MIKCYDKVGKMTIKQHSNGMKFKIDIWRGNCLAVFTYDFTRDGETWQELWSFFDDEQHVKNILKNHDGKLFSYVDIVNVELNLYYDNAKKLMNIFIKNGIKVKVYYKEPKTKK